MSNMQLDATTKLNQELPKLLPTHPLLPRAGDLAVPQPLWTPLSALIWARVGEMGLPFQQHPTGRVKDKLPQHLDERNFTFTPTFLLYLIIFNYP